MMASSYGKTGKHETLMILRKKATCTAPGKTFQMKVLSKNETFG